MASVIFANDGSNVGAKSRLAKWIMPLIRRQPRGSPKFRSNNSNDRSHSSSQMVKRSLLPKPCIARCDIDLRGNGWRGATIMSLVSHGFPRLLTSSSRSIAVSDQPLLDCFGARTCGRRLFFGRGAGFSVCLVSSISSHSSRFGSKSMGLLAAMASRRLVGFSRQFGSNSGQTPIFFYQRFAGSTRVTRFYISFAVAALSFLFFCFLFRSLHC